MDLGPEIWCRGRLGGTHDHASGKNLLRTTCQARGVPAVPLRGVARWHHAQAPTVPECCWRLARVVLAALTMCQFWALARFWRAPDGPEKSLRCWHALSSQHLREKRA